MDITSNSGYTGSMLSWNSYSHLGPLWNGAFYIMATGYMQNLAKKSTEAFPAVPLPDCQKQLASEYLMNNLIRILAQTCYLFTHSAWVKHIKCISQGLASY